MGMYTEFHFNAELEGIPPHEVMSILTWMIGANNEEPKELPDHPLFKTSRWAQMLRSDSFYFDACTHSTIKDDQGLYLCIRCNLKNYEDEIEKFIDWVMPYLNKQEGDFLGFHRYEETETPELIFYKIPEDAV